MALDFPSSPTVGQLFPVPAVAGAPVWKWDGAAWVQTSVAGSSSLGAFSQYEYTATASQTTFSGADINSATLAYTVGYLLVFINGTKINKADYTATNGTSVVFSVGRSVGDKVTIITLTVANVLNALLTTNNLSDLTNAATARTNLGGFGAVKLRTYTASGTYTPDPHLLYALIECQGGGGGSGGVVTVASNYANSSGGGGGAYASKLASAATIGVSQTVTIGAAGTAGASGANAGGNGGTTSVGTLCIASGGLGGAYAQAGVAVTAGAAGGQTGTGEIVIPGGSGGGGMGVATASGGFLFGGWGGASRYSGSIATALGSNGISPAANTGAGAAGAQDLATANKAGAAGGLGVVYITEYCSS